jgi:ubiquinone/menaquinone biosynthesis C-methylase UbiE
MPGGDEIRDVQRAAWAGLSAGWEKWDPVIMDQLGPVGTAIIERLDIAGDQQHLDIAAGTGEPGLTVARLAPRGHVVLTDLAAEMLDIATRRANAQGITNFETTVCSAGDLPFGDATFGSISVRFGYMFFPNLAKATAEFARVLKPGGPGMVVLLVAAVGDRGIPAEVPLVEWPDAVVLVGDEAVHRHHVVHDYRAHQVLLESSCAFAPDLVAPGGDWA